MKARGAKLFSSFVCVVMVCLLASVAAADALILGVPDINQPDWYAGGGGPTAGLNVGDYPGWCCPTSGAMVMGYWEDIKGCTGLTDRLVFPASPAYPVTAGTWQQGLWHDGTVEMGWHMDTGGWQSVPRGFPPLFGSTMLINVGPGMLNYANAAWVDNNYPPAGPAPGTGIVKVAYPDTAIAKDTVRGAAMWANYMAEIDAGRPSVVSWQHWVLAQTGQTWLVNGQTVWEYSWNMSTPEHCVAGVGYIDPTPQQFIGDEFIIAQDNWQTTVQYVAVPVDVNWLQNDYVTHVPEPVTMVLLTLGGVVLIRRRRRG